MIERFSSKNKHNGTTLAKSNGTVSPTTGLPRYGTTTHGRLREYHTQYRSHSRFPTERQLDHLSTGLCALVSEKFPFSIVIVRRGESSVTKGVVCVVQSPDWLTVDVPWGTSL